MTSSLFKEWFHDNFVPHVREKLTSFSLEPKAVVVLDNCSAHPDPQELVSDDGKFFAKFLPPNVTSLIQPMDQGVLISLKRRYRKELLHRLIIEDEVGTSIIEFLKGLNMKTTIDLVAEAWDDIPSTTMQRSWRKILPLPCSSSDTCGNGDNGMNESHGVNQHTGGRSENGPTVDDFISTLADLHYEFSADEVSEWLQCDMADPGVQLLSDDEICEMVMTDSREEEEEGEEDEEEGEEDEETIEDTYSCPVSHSEAATMLEKCLIWLEHQAEASVYKTTMLRKLRQIAVRKRVQSLWQTTVTSYYSQE